MTQDVQRPPKERKQKGLVRAAGAMGIATLISRFLGLIREQVFAYLFGAGNLTDAFNVAFRIPNLFRDLFAEGAMSASLVPTFTLAREKEGPRRAWRVAGLVFRVLFAIVCALSILGMIFAPEIVGLYASAFKVMPGKFELTVLLTRIMFPFFPLVVLAAAYMGVLNASGVFFLPSLASALFNLSSIIVGVGSVWLIGEMNYGIQPIVGMAIGVVVGGATQAFCQLPALYKTGYRWVSKQSKDPAWWKDPHLKKMLAMMLPGTVGLAATQINILVNTVLATSQGPGAVSWLNYAFRLMQFPIGVFGVSLASATLTELSYHWARNDTASAENTLMSSMRNVFAVNLPASAGLAFLGLPIIELIFQYGRFYPQDTRATALALGMYAIGLTAYSAVKVLVPACYALGNTRIAVLSSVISVALTITLNLMMIRPFGYWGLALGTSVAAIFNALFLLVFIQKLIRKQGGQFDALNLLLPFAKYLLLALAMGAVCYGSQGILSILLPNAFFNHWLGGTGIVLARTIRMGLLVGEGVLVVVALARIFRLSEILEVVDIFRGKLKIKLRLGQT